MLNIKNLKKSYNKPILLDIHLSAQKGDCIGILGENGCGKSTLLEIISGALKADGGEIFIDGKSADKNHRLFEEYIGYVPQENPIIDELSVEDNLSLWYCFSNRDMENDFENGPAGMLGLKEVRNKKAASLSGGMKKRLSIASALSNDAPILLLDEPSAALDIVCKNEIHTYISLYRQKGGTVLFTTHEESELYLCNKLYLMKNGRLWPISQSLRGKALMEAMAK